MDTRMETLHLRWRLHREPSFTHAVDVPKHHAHHLASTPVSFEHRMSLHPMPGGSCYAVNIRLPPPPDGEIGKSLWTLLRRGGS